MTKLKELTEWELSADGLQAGGRQAAVPWRFGHALHLVLELSVLRGYFVPVFHQFCFLFGVLALV